MPGEKAATPDLSKIFPAPPEADEADEFAAPQPDLRPARTETGDQDSIRGTVQLAEEVTEAAPSGAILFVIARPKGITGGPPLASRRFDAPRFPLQFEIGQEHVMLPGNLFRGEIQLTARLDLDGDPMTRLPGDIQGSAPGSVAPGAERVEIVLRQRL